MNVSNTTALAESIGQANEMQSRSLMRLSSGIAFVSAGDNPAGQADSSAYSSANGRLMAASMNIQNALSFTQAADGNMSAIQGILTRMRELATMAQDPTKTAQDKGFYQTEFASLQGQLRSTIGGPTSAIGGTADVTSPFGMFNGIVQFGGGSPQIVSTGTGANDNISIPPINLQQGATASVISQDSSGNFTLSVTDLTAASTLGSAIAQVGAAQGQNVGVETRLQIAANTNQVMAQNLTSAISSISDTDVAAESTRLSTYKILEQAGMAMLSQANANSAEVYKLLKAS